MAQTSTKKNTSKSKENSGKKGSTSKVTGSTGKGTSSKSSRTNSASKNRSKSVAERAGSLSDEQLASLKRRRHLLNLLLGGVLAFAGFLILLSLAGVDAFIVKWLGIIISGLFGWGIYLAPVAFVLMGALVVAKEKKGGKARAGSLFIALIMISGFGHVFREPIDIPYDATVPGYLWSSGIAKTTGGVISGGMSHILVDMISKPGTGVLLILFAVFCLVYTFKIPVRKTINQKAQLHQQERAAISAQRQQERQEQFQVQQLQLQDYDTVQDLRELLTPLPRAEKSVNAFQLDGKKKNFDVPLGTSNINTEKVPAKTARKRKKQPATTKLQADEELLYSAKRTQKLAVPAEQVEQPADDTSRFDIPVSGTATIRKEARNATGDASGSTLPQAKTQKQIKEPELDQVEPLFQDILFDEPQSPDDEECATGGKTPESASAVQTKQLTKAQLERGAEAEQRNRQLNPGEADAAERSVTRSINKTLREDEKPYHFPSTSHLSQADTMSDDDNAETVHNIDLLERTLASFGFDIKVTGKPVRGPSVTRYELKLPLGTKMNRITSLNEDIALALGVASIRVAAVTGKSSTIGIEIPNKQSTSVPIRSVLDSRAFKNAKSNLTFAVGKNISGDTIVGDIAKMPHLLIAGTTGSGKSVCMNSIIVSLLYRSTPKQVRMIMIDPKVVELSVYNGIPHLLIPVVTDAKKAAGALQWAVTEMERRYNLLAEFNVRDIAGYNKQAAQRDDMEPLPQIVIIIDELADLMLVAAKDVENSIVRIAQKARAAGMYLVIATQRPSANVITGLMKANIPSRIAFAVSSAIDSRIILDTAGAEKLLGKGDMLFNPIGSLSPTRVQGCFITDEEVEEVVAEVKGTAGEAEYDSSITAQINQNAEATSGAGSAGKAGSADEGEAFRTDGDPQLPDAVEVILDTKQASVSMLQRRLKLGYAHAARIVDEMEEKGIVGPFEGSKPRQLLITREQWDTMVGVNPRAKAAGSSPVPPQSDAAYEDTMSTDLTS